jgi:hypothetical protein
MKKWEEEQRQKAHVRRVIEAKPTLSKLYIHILTESETQSQTRMPQSALQQTHDETVQSSVVVQPPNKQFISSGYSSSSTRLSKMQRKTIFPAANTSTSMIAGMKEPLSPTPSDYFKQAPLMPQPEQVPLSLQSQRSLLQPQVQYSNNTAVMPPQIISGLKKMDVSKENN